MSKQKQLLSIVIPSYNEEKNVSLIYKEIVKNIDKNRYSYELIFVNDGSSDSTWGAIDTLAEKDVNVRGLNFSRNFGHHAALEAGLNEARGDIVIMMDADLQHPPKLIPALLEKHEQGFDIVNTVRTATEGVGAGKNISSRMFYAVLNGISDLQLREGEADYRLLSRRALDVLNALPESPKFYRGLVNWIGYDVARIEYTASKRMHGKSSYTLRKMIEFARIGLTSFSMRPLKWIMSFGVGIMAISTLSLIIMVAVKLFLSPDYFSNNALLIMFLVFITGVLATIQGIVAMYMVDIHNATKGRPTYIIKERASAKRK